VAHRNFPIAPACYFKYFVRLFDIKRDRFLDEDVTPSFKSTRDNRFMTPGRRQYMNDIRSRLLEQSVELSIGPCHAQRLGKCARPPGVAIANPNKLDRSQTPDGAQMRLCDMTTADDRSTLQATLF
jgi:hypothetical protein